MFGHNLPCATCIRPSFGNALQKEAESFGDGLVLAGKRLQHMWNQITLLPRAGGAWGTTAKIGDSCLLAGKLQLAKATTIDWNSSIFLPITPVFSPETAS